MKRRDAIKAMGALAGAAAAPKLLAGCGGDDGPGSIDTFVTVMMENRSYDHYMGARTLVEGLAGNGLTASMSNPNASGDVISPYHEQTDLILAQDPLHGWDASHSQWNDGANDGFVTVHQGAYGQSVSPHPMGHLTRDDIPFLYAMADAGSSCDAWFSSLMGPTWPNRMYLLSAQSGGRKTNDLPENGGFDWPTIFHVLDEAGIEWAYYWQDLPFVPLWKGLETEGRVRRFFPQFFNDAEAGTLPPVVFVEPDFGVNDDHPPHHPILGQQFLASVYAALAASPQWKRSLLTITYDEHGGFFDHVAPPTAADSRAAEGFDQLGFRVPSVAIGPYVKQGHVSSVVRDHTSVIAHITRALGLPSLTDRDAAANDLSELLDLERLERGEPLPPPELPAVEVPESLLRSAVFDRQSALVDIEHAANAGWIPARFDGRKTKLDQLYGIGDVLERLGAGRIVRGR